MSVAAWLTANRRPPTATASRTAPRMSVRTGFLRLLLGSASAPATSAAPTTTAPAGVGPGQPPQVRRQPRQRIADADPRNGGDRQQPGNRARVHSLERLVGDADDQRRQADPETLECPACQQAEEAGGQGREEASGQHDGQGHKDDGFAPGPVPELAEPGVVTAPASMLTVSVHCAATWLTCSTATVGTSGAPRLPRTAVTKPMKTRLGARPGRCGRFDAVVMVSPTVSTVRSPSLVITNRIVTT